MANPSKAKGTSGETELLRLLADAGVEVRRTPPGTQWDLESYHEREHVDYPVLATRPDHGEWLVTMRLREFIDSVPEDAHLRIEVKRYKRFSLHSIFQEKFGV